MHLKLLQKEQLKKKTQITGNLTANKNPNKTTTKAVAKVSRDFFTSR